MIKLTNPFQKTAPPSDNFTENRKSGCRRVSFDTKYLGLGKCVDRRKNARRKEDRFDQDGYEQLCRKRLGPGWL